MADLMSVWVYQFEDCLHACVSFKYKKQNFQRSSCNNSSCTAVTYAYNYTYGDLSAGHAAGNCFLKTENSTGPNDAFFDTAVDSAFLHNIVRFFGALSNEIENSKQPYKQ